MAQITIRRAREGDLAALLGLYRLLGEEKPTAAPASGDAAAAIVAEAIADGARHLVVAEADGEVRGTADMVIVPNLTHHGAPWAIVENVLVAEDSRRRGIATEMIGHLVEVARAHGCCKVQLLSGKHRAGAHAMYERVGFRAVAEGFKIYFDEGPAADPG